MSDTILKRIATLLSVKSLVTLVLTGVFAWMAVSNAISQDFMTIYAVIIAFYFGTQAEKRSQEPAETMTGTLVLPAAVSESDTKGGDGNGDGAATA